MASPSQSEDISLFNNPTLSDVKIQQIYKGEVKEYFAHKAILSAHSKWFLKAFTGIFKEASEHTIKVCDDDPQNFEYMLKFLYTHEVVVPPVKTSTYRKETIDRKILIPIGLYVLTDKYEIASLLRSTLNQVATTIIIHKHLLNKTANDTAPTIVAAYYNSCACARSRMGVVIASGLHEHSSWLSYGDVDALSSLVIKYSHFAADLILAMRTGGHLG